MRATLVRSMLATAIVSAAIVASPVAALSSAPACGSDWTKVSTPSPGTIFSVLLDVATVGTGDAWSVGFRSYVDDEDMYAVSPIIERWDGVSWTVAYQPSSQGQLAGVFALASDDVWAVGHTGLESPEFQPLIMHWDGTSWERVNSPSAPMGYLTAIGGSGPDDLWTAGTLIGTYDTIIEHWDGTRWRKVEHPSPSSDYVAFGGLAAAGPDDVSIVGTYLDGQARSAPLALHWDGAVWQRTKPKRVGALGTSLNDVTVTGGGRVWAVGSYVTAGGATQALAERWTGRRWIEASPVALDGASSLASVTAGPDGVWAVGSRTRPDQPAETLTERWRRQSDEWQDVASPGASGDDYLLGVDQSPAGEFWAVGFHRPGEQELTLAVHRCRPLDKRDW